MLVGCATTRFERMGKWRVCGGCRLGGGKGDQRMGDDSGIGCFSSSEDSDLTCVWTSIESAYHHTTSGISTNLLHRLLIVHKPNTHLTRRHWLSTLPFSRVGLLNQQGMGQTKLWTSEQQSKPSSSGSAAAQCAPHTFANVGDWEGEKGCRSCNRSRSAESR